MKILTLLENKLDRKEIHSSVDNLLQSTHALGLGSDAAVFKADKHVNKITNTATDYDGYLQYILQSSELRKAGNPFLPVVKNIKHFKDKNGTSFSKFTLEKLYPITDCEDFELEEIYYQITNIRRDDVSAKDILHKLIDYVRGVESTPNKELNQVINLINNILKQGKLPGGTASADIRLPNIMVRRNNDSVHLVITDPITGSIGVKRRFIQ